MLEGSALFLPGGGEAMDTADVRTLQQPRSPLIEAGADDGAIGGFRIEQHNLGVAHDGELAAEQVPREGHQTVR